MGPLASGSKWIEPKHNSEIRRCQRSVEGMWIFVSYDLGRKIEPTYKGISHGPFG